MWQKLTHPVAGTHFYLKSPLTTCRRRRCLLAPASTLGQDNEYVYKKLLGYSDEEYQRFVETNHAGTTFINEPHVGGRE